MNQIKMIMIVIGLACFMTAGVASAATLELEKSKNAFTMVDCDLLANDVDIMLTSGVVGGIDCDTDNNAIGLSTCHTAGLTSERSEEVEENGETSTKTVSGASFPSASTLQGTVSSSFPEVACDAGAAVGAATAKKDADLKEEG